MKINQSFLYGMGSGLIIASILFGASDLLEASSKPQGSLLSPPAATQPAGSQSTASQPTPAQTNPQQAAEQQQPNTPHASDQQQPASPPAQPPAATKVKIEIKEGMDGIQIAQLLVKNGVISNAESFLNTAGDRVKSIRIGVYELPAGGNPEQIITLITQK